MELGCWVHHWRQQSVLPRVIRWSESQPPSQTSIFFLPDLCVPLSFPILYHPTHPSLPLARRESAVADGYYHLCRGFHLVAAISNVVSGSARRLGEGGDGWKRGRESSIKITNLPLVKRLASMQGVHLVCLWLHRARNPSMLVARSGLLPCSHKSGYLFSVFAWTRKKRRDSYQKGLQFIAIKIILLR